MEALVIDVQHPKILDIIRQIGWRCFGIKHHFEAIRSISNIMFIILFLYSVYG